jgi:hypothetical protein
MRSATPSALGPRLRTAQTLPLVFNICDVAVDGTDLPISLAASDVLKTLL